MEFVVISKNYLNILKTIFVFFTKLFPLFPSADFCTRVTLYSNDLDLLSLFPKLAGMSSLLYCRKLPDASE